MQNLKRTKLSALGATIAAGLLATAGANAAAGIDHKELVTSVTYGYATHDERTLTAELELQPAMDFSYGDLLSGRLSVRIRGEDRDLWLPGEPDLDNYTKLSRPYAAGDHWLAELRDAYLDVRLPNGLLRLGKQQIVWGALDGIKVLDALNPQSFERFILEDFDASRIGLWSAYADLSFGAWRTELALIPDTTTHYVPASGAFMAFTAPRYRFGATASEPALPVNQLRPPTDNPSAGLRVSRYVGGVDLQFIAISGLDFEPLGQISLDNGTPVLETFHEQRQLYGISAVTSFSRFALRSEISFSPQRAFNTRDTSARLNQVDLDQWRGAVGVDINAPWNLFVNLQFLHDEVERPPEDLIRSRKERLFTAFVRRRFAYDALDVELRFYQSLEQHDRLLRAAISYEVSDSMRVELAMEDFKGDARGPFGQFEQRDQVSITWELTL